MEVSQTAQALANEPKRCCRCGLDVSKGGRFPAIEPLPEGAASNAKLYDCAPCAARLLMNELITTKGGLEQTTQQLQQKTKELEKKTKELEQKTTESENVQREYKKLYWFLARNDASLREWEARTQAAEAKKRKTSH